MNHGLLSLETLEDYILDWAQDRGILAQSTPEDQWGKAYEEMGELYKAIRSGDTPAIADGLGDVLVCLTVLAEMKDLDLHKCLRAAWHEIKDRKGQMVNGLFVKEETT